MNVKSVLLVSYHSSLNNGDRALLEVNINQLRAAFDNPQITMAVAWPDEPYFHQTKKFKVIRSAWQLLNITMGSPVWLQIINFLLANIYALLFRLGMRAGIPSDWRTLFEAYQKADVIASVSSTHFYSTGRYGWPFPVKIFMVQLAHFFGKPFYVMPQSIGPLRWGWEKFMLHSAYKKARLILLRDHASMRLAENIHLPKDKVRFAPDPALAFCGDSQADALGLLGRYGFDPARPSIGMSLIPWQGRWVNQDIMHNYFSELAKFLKRFYQETGVQVYVYNQVTGPTPLDDDRLAAKELIEQIGAGASWLTHIDEVLSPEMLKACYGCMDLFIASRLHSGIFAIGSHVPTVFIGYMSKTRGMMEWMGLEKWVVDLNDVTEAVLWEKCSLAWQERASLRSFLAARIPSIVSDVNATGNLIRENYAAQSF